MTEAAELACKGVGGAKELAGVNGVLAGESEIDQKCFETFQVTPP